MSKKSFKYLLLCLTLLIPTFCMNVVAMKEKSNNNLNTTNNTLNTSMLKNKTKTIKKSKSEDNLTFNPINNLNKDQTKNNEEIIKNNKNKSEKKPKFRYPLKFLLKDFDKYHYNKVEKKLKDPKTTDTETINMAVLAPLQIYPTRKTIRDLLVKCGYCIKKINDYYNKFLYITKNHDPSINIIPEIRCLYISILYYNRNFAEIIEDAKRANLNIDQIKNLNNIANKNCKNNLEIKKYLEKLNPIYKEIFPFYNKKTKYEKIKVMYKQLNEIKNIYANPKNTPLNKISYSFVKDNDDILNIKNKTPDKKIKHINNFKNKTPDKKMDSIFPFYSLNYSLNSNIDKIYNLEIIENLKDKKISDEDAISIINSEKIVSDIMKNTDNLNTTKHLICRIKYFYDTINKYWNNYIDTYKNLCAKGGIEEYKNKEEYKRVLRTTFAVLSHYNIHFKEIKQNKISLLKQFPVPIDPNKPDIITFLENIINQNYKNINLLKNHLKNLNPIYEKLLYF